MRKQGWIRHTAIEQCDGVARGYDCLDDGRAQKMGSTQHKNVLGFDRTRRLRQQWNACGTGNRGNGMLNERSALHIDPVSLDVFSSPSAQQLGVDGQGPRS